MLCYDPIAKIQSNIILGDDMDQNIHHNADMNEDVL